MDFDPYREWLEIPPGPRPPDYYALLGLPTGESDAARIEAAVMERTANVRRYQIGARGDAALRLITELSEAFACLSDRERKRQYDQRLQGATTIVEEQSLGQTQRDAPVVEPPPVQAPASGVVFAGPRRPKLNTIGAAKKTPDPLDVQLGAAGRPVPTRKYAAMAAAALAGFAVPLLLLWAFSGRGPEMTESPPQAGDATSTEVESSAGAGSGPGVATAPADAPPEPTPAPTIRIADHRPPAPTADQTLWVRLEGQADAPGALTYQYRLEPDAVWQTATGPNVEIANLKPGTLTVMFRSVDARGAASQELARTWQVSAAEPPKVAATIPKPAPKKSPPKATATNRPPTVAIVRVRPEQPLAGETVQFVLQGEDPEFSKNFTYEYRPAATGRWLAAPRGEVQLANVAAGKLAVEFRCLDEQKLPSEVLTRELTVEANPFAAWDHLQQLKGHTDAVTSLAIRTNVSIISGSQDATARVWKLSDGQFQRALPSGQGALKQVLLSRDGANVAGLSALGTVEVWHLTKGTLLRTASPYTMPGAGFGGFGGLGGFGGMAGLAGALSGPSVLSPDGAIAVYVTNQSVLQWFQIQANGTMKAGAVLNHPDIATSLLISRDGKLLAVGSQDGEIMVYRMADGKLAQTLQGHASSPTALAFSPDGELLASGDAKGEIHVWLIRTGQRQCSLRCDNSGVQSLLMNSGNSGALAAGDGAGKIRIWRTSDGRLMRTMSGHDGAVRSLAIAPSGTLLVSGGDDATVRLWGPPGAKR